MTLLRFAVEHDLVVPWRAVLWSGSPGPVSYYESRKAQRSSERVPMAFALAEHHEVGSAVQRHPSLAPRRVR